MSPTMILGRVVLPGVGLLLAAALVWQTVRSAPARTESATPPPVRGRPAAPLPRDRITAEGRVVTYPGGEVTAGTEVLGTILCMPVKERSAVRKGDLLAELRADEVQATLREAHSRLIEAEVELRFQQERIRLDKLFPTLSGRNLVQASSVHDTSAALARRDAVKASVERAEAEAARYRILAPLDGVVIARHADPGETVNAAAPLVTIADLTRLRVEAEVDEFDIGRVTLGAGATIAAEGYGGRSWPGEVEEIADVVTGRRTRPEDPAQPSDTHVLPVKIKFRASNPLKLGQRVEVEIAAPAGDRSPKAGVSADP